MVCAVRSEQASPPLRLRSRGEDWRRRTLSKTVDQQRREQAARDELERQIDVVSHTLRVLLARRNGQPVTVIAAVTNVSPRTVDNRIALARQLLARVGERKMDR